MAQLSSLNSDWRFLPDDPTGAEAPSFDDSSWEIVSIPHTNKLLPHHCFDDAEYQFVSWYRRRLTVPQVAAAGRVFIDFGGVMTAAEVFVNGAKVAEHRGGYTPFSADITGHVAPGKEAVVAVRVDSTERPDIPPFGRVVDYLTFGGIYRDVQLRTCARSYISDLFLRSYNVLVSPVLEASLKIEHPADDQTLHLSVADMTGKVIGHIDTPVLGEEQTVRLEDLSVDLWSLDTPVLYLVEASLIGSDGTVIDSTSTRFGFRDARFCKDGVFRLNDEPIKLIGLDRHQTFPYIGQAAPARLQRRDADILKFDLSLNIVRTSHYPQSPHFLDRCDEVGLLVFEEIPGWQFIGDDDWKQVAKDNVREMIIRDRNHPSIILWGVRINESADDHDFYVETNRIAHELDPSRQTGGVRCHVGSEFLEDVYTFNDFVFPLRDPQHIPYLITEFNGHMFPTKTYDNEERRLEHALRHARIQSAQMLDRRISGGIGWCAFDYNTHFNFGSGDRICYHGVSDIFRLPKWAAHVYSSQADPATKVVLEPATQWSHGDRSGGGVEPLVIFSNCDTIKVYYGDDFKGEFHPNFREFGGLAHPPFVLRGLGWPWGSSNQDLKIEGFVSGEKVAEVQKPADPLPYGVRLWADSEELVADGQDMTALNFQVVDACGGVLPYSSEVISISAEGPVEIIGTNPFAPQGGQGAVYLKSTREPGRAVLTAMTPRLGASSIKLRLLASPG